MREERERETKAGGGDCTEREIPIHNEQQLACRRGKAKCWRRGSEGGNGDRGAKDTAASGKQKKNQARGEMFAADVRGKYEVWVGGWYGTKL